MLRGVGCGTTNSNLLSELIVFEDLGDVRETVVDVSGATAAQLTLDVGDVVTLTTRVGVEYLEQRRRARQRRDVSALVQASDEVVQLKPCSN